MKSYRKLLALGLAAAMAVGMAVTASAAAPVTVTVNGADATAAAYVNDDWRTMVSTDIADDLGLTATVSGDSVTFTDGTTSQTYTVGAAVEDTAVELVDGAIYVPFAPLAQTFGYTVGWDGAAGVASAQKAEETLTVDDIASIQAYTDETIYGTGVVEVVVTYKDGVDLSGVTADSYILEDRGSLSPDYGQIAIESAAVDGQTVTLTISDASQATAKNALIYSGENAGVRERNAFGIYSTGAWYRDAEGIIHYGAEDTEEYAANTTGMGYQSRACLELKLRHAGEAESAAACLANEKGQYNEGGLWLETVDRQFGEGGFQSFAELGIQIVSTAAEATDGTQDQYVRGYAYIPDNYDPANGIVFTLQGQGISYWQLQDGCNNDGTGIMYDSATTSWADNGAIVVNIHDRSSAGKGDYSNYYDFVVDDVNAMKYFIETYDITGPIVLQGNSRGTVASSNVIKALAGLEYTVNSDEARGTNQLDKSVYDFEIDTFICQNGMFGRGVYTEADYQAIAETGLKVWIFDGEQDTNNIDTYTAYVAAAEAAGYDEAWIAENIRLTCYPSEIYAYWGESDHSTTRINGWYFDDAAYYGPDLTMVDGEIVYNTQLSDGDVYTVLARGASRDGGMEKTGFEYTVYDELFQDWALPRLGCHHNCAGPVQSAQSRRGSSPKIRSTAPS